MPDNRAQAEAGPRAGSTVTAARKRLQKLFDRLGTYRAVQDEIGSSNVQYPYNFLVHGVLPANVHERELLLRWRRRKAGQEWRTYPSGLEQAILDVLTDHVGADDAIGRWALVRAVQTAGLKCSERSVREAIKQLRRREYLILAMPGNEGGYYMARSMEEVESFDREELGAKIADMNETRQAMLKAAHRRFDVIVEQPELLPGGQP